MYDVKVSSISQEEDDTAVLAVDPMLTAIRGLVQPS
jgi:hypothetical protein